MKRVSDIEHPKIDSYVRFRRGGGENEGNVIAGRVHEYLGDGTYMINDTESEHGCAHSFNYEDGDRIVWVSNKPWKPMREDTARKDENARLDIMQRTEFGMRMARLTRERDVLLATTLLSVLSLLVYAGVRDGAAIIATLF